MDNPDDERTIINVKGISVAACAAVTFAWLSAPAGAQPGGVCGESQTHEAQAKFLSGSLQMDQRLVTAQQAPTKAEVTAGVRQLFAQLETDVRAAMAQCPKGATIAVPKRYAGQYCNPNKSTINDFLERSICTKR